MVKVLVVKQFCTYRIPAKIHSDWGKSVDNKIIEQPGKMYGIEQSNITSYNPHGNSPCKQLNQMLQNLMETLQKDKTKLARSLSTLVFVYNATPHSTTGYQPYQLMFGHKAQTPCNNCLGLSQYKCSKSISKDSWVYQQYELV